MREVHVSDRGGLPEGITAELITSHSQQLRPEVDVDPVSADITAYHTDAWVVEAHLQKILDLYHDTGRIQTRDVKRAERGGWSTFMGINANALQADREPRIGELVVDNETLFATLSLGGWARAQKHHESKLWKPRYRLSPVIMDIGVRLTAPAGISLDRPIYRPRPLGSLMPLATFMSIPYRPNGMLDVYWPRTIGLDYRAMRGEDGQQRVHEVRDILQAAQESLEKEIQPTA